MSFRPYHFFIKYYLYLYIIARIINLVVFSTKYQIKILTSRNTILLKSGRLFKAFS